MLNAYRTGMNRILYKEREGLILHKEGHILKVSLLVKPQFSLQLNEFKYITFMQPVLLGDKFILTDHHGRLDSYSLPFGEVIGLPPSLVRGANLYAFHLFPTLATFFYDKYLHFDETDGQDMILDFAAKSPSLRGMEPDINGFFSTYMKIFNNYECFGEVAPFQNADFCSRRPNKRESSANLKKEAVADKMAVAYKKSVNRYMNSHNVKNAMLGASVKIDFFLTSINYLILIRVDNVVRKSDRHTSHFFSIFCKTK